MQPERSGRIVASYPLDSEHVAVRFNGSAHAPDGVSFSLASGLTVRGIVSDDGMSDRIVLAVETMSAVPVTTDHVVARLEGGDIIGPPFAHGPLSATELKVPHFEPRFPFTSRLVGLHVTVACCTGCDGGVHDRGLVVVNDHVGGGWSGIWVRTPKPIEGPYPRWQRMVFAGGVVHDHGSAEVVDHGWMEFAKDDETPHHPPPPLPVSCADVPGERTTALRTHSLDGAWVELADLRVEEAEVVEPSPRRDAGRLPRTDATVSDTTGVRSRAWLFQDEREAVRPGARIARLRGFLRAEARGQYVLLTDKSEDIEL